MARRANDIFRCKALSSVARGLYEVAHAVTGFTVLPLREEAGKYVAPVAGQPARIAWHGWSGEENTPERLDVHHAWLLEDLPGNRVRILTQETQNGEPAKAMASTRPNPMLNGHQEWLDGLVDAALKAAKA
ncbi:Uncharacterised protein [Klebsiella variicola]|nr:Uncharacterised protein [Klebsiella variicola]